VAVACLNIWVVGVKKPNNDVGNPKLPSIPPTAVAFKI